MQRFRIILVAALVTLPTVLTFSGSATAAASGGRTEYLAGQDIIVEPRDIEVSEFVSAIDYGYPEPDGDLGVYVYPGQYQVSTDSQEVYLTIGLQAARRKLEDLPPLNIAFVVDTSGSMGGADKITWVRESLEVFVRSVRKGDTISLVCSDPEPRVLLPSTRIVDDDDRSEFLRAVRDLKTGGNTHLYDGLELGFGQVLVGLSSANVNRIVLLSDGLPASGSQDTHAFQDLVQGYRELGVSVSAIGFGMEADLALIRDIARWSSGTSRFIDDRETMEETFGRGLGRLIVPVAREVVVDVRLASGVRLVNTWGYEHQTIGSTVTYNIPALHDSDDETMIAILDVPASTRPGNQRIATVETSYVADDATIVNVPSVAVHIDRVEIGSPVVGVTDAMALRAVTMLRYGQVLMEVGQRYYDDNSRTLDHRLSVDVAESLLGLVTRLKFEMENAELRLDEPVFTHELAVLGKYQDILAEELQIAQESRLARYEQFRGQAPDPERTVGDQIDALVAELRLSMRTLSAGRVAVLGVAGVGEVDPSLGELLASRTTSAIATLGQLTIATPEAVESQLQTRAVTSSDLVDAALAAELGRDLDADYVVTGMLIASPRTFHLFERVIRASDGEVLSAAQVMAPR